MIFKELHGGFSMQLQFMQMLFIMMVIVAPFFEICNKLKFLIGQFFNWSTMSIEVGHDYPDSVDRIREIYQNIELVQKKILTVTTTTFDEEEKSNLLSV
jgi:hypothetical protein